MCSHCRDSESFYLRHQPRMGHVLGHFEMVSDRDYGNQTSIHSNIYPHKYRRDGGGGLNQGSHTTRIILVDSIPDPYPVFLIRVSYSGICKIKFGWKMAFVTLLVIGALVSQVPVLRQYHAGITPVPRRYHAGTTPVLCLY